MSAAQDLRDIRDAIDGMLVGWIGWRQKLSTKAGAECLDMVNEARRRLYKSWGENCALRTRLAAALREVDGLRATNELLTNTLDNSAARPGKGKAKAR